MSHTIITNLFLNHNLKNTELLCALALAHHINRNTSTAWPSVTRLAWHIRRSVRQTQRVLRKLEVMGVIVIHYGRGRGGTNLYRFVQHYLHRRAPDIARHTPLTSYGHTNPKEEEHVLKKGLQFWTQGSPLWELAGGVLLPPAPA